MCRQCLVCWMGSILEWLYGDTRFIAKLADEIVFFLQSENVFFHLLLDKQFRHFTGRFCSSEKGNIVCTLHECWLKWSIRAAKSLNEDLDIFKKKNISEQWNNCKYSFYLKSIPYFLVAWNSIVPNALVIWSKLNRFLHCTGYFMSFVADLRFLL